MMNSKHAAGIACLCASSLILALLVPAVVVAPKRAYAVLPVVETGLNLVKSSITAIATGATSASTAISASKDTRDLVEDYVIRPMAIALAKAAIQSITQSTVNWINGGFDGSPAFVADLNKNLRQLGDGVAQNFLTELAQNTKINSPYLDSLITNVGTAYYLYSGKDALAARLEDTLGTASQNPAAFRAGNFQEGGWDAWFESFANPANNPIGANMIASQALSERISAAVVQRTQELSYGSGFLSWRGDCIEADISMAQQAASGQTADDAARSSTIANLSDAEGCIGREIITPGSFIENKLNVTSDSPLRQLELAQSIDAIVGALAQQLISKALGGGGGLRGVSQPAQGGGSSAATTATTNTSTDVVTSQEALAVTMQTNITQLTAWKTDAQKILTAATAAEAACTNNPTLLAHPVRSSHESSSAIVSEATTLIVSLTQLLGQLQTSTERDEALSQSTYLEISSAYQGLNLPSTARMSETAAQAQDAVGGGTTLYTTLTTLASNGCVATDTIEIPEIRLLR